jgi:hypothetical protein
VEAVEDRENDAVDAGGVHEADHGQGATSHFHEAAFDEVVARSLRSRFWLDFFWQVC